MTKIPYNVREISAVENGIKFWAEDELGAIRQWLEHSGAKYDDVRIERYIQDGHSNAAIGQAYKFRFPEYRSVVVTEANYLLDYVRADIPAEKIQSHYYVEFNRVAVPRIYVVETLANGIRFGPYVGFSETEALQKFIADALAEDLDFDIAQVDTVDYANTAVTEATDWDFLDKPAPVAEPTYWILKARSTDDE